MIIPIINNYINRELVHNGTVRLETCLYMWVPFDYGFNFNNWYLMHTASTYCCGAGSAVVAGFDTINFTFIFNLIGHIEILKHKITTNFADKNLNQDEIKKRLEEIIKYHAFIIE